MLKCPTQLPDTGMHECVDPRWPLVAQGFIPASITYQTSGSGSVGLGVEAYKCIVLDPISPLWNSILLELDLTSLKLDAISMATGAGEDERRLTSCFSALWLQVRWSGLIVGS